MSPSYSACPSVLLFPATAAAANTVNAVEEVTLRIAMRKVERYHYFFSGFTSASTVACSTQNYIGSCAFKDESLWVWDVASVSWDTAFRAWLRR